MISNSKRAQGVADLGLPVISEKLTVNCSDCFSGYRCFFFPLSLAVKQSAREADLSSPYSAEVTNEWSCTSASPVWFHGCAQRQLSFTVQTRYNVLIYCCLYTACSEVTGGTHFFGITVRYETKWTRGHLHPKLTFVYNVWYHISHISGFSKNRL